MSRKISRILVGYSHYLRNVILREQLQIVVNRPSKKPQDPTARFRVGTQIHEPAALRMHEAECEVGSPQASPGVLEPLHQQDLTGRGRRGLNTVLKS